MPIHPYSTATHPFGGYSAPGISGIICFRLLSLGLAECTTTNPITSHSIHLPTLLIKQQSHTSTMAAFSTRINLLPTSRTLASGVPFAPRIALVHPPASHGHGTSGPRSDVPPKWTGSQGGYASNSRINSESRSLLLIVEEMGMLQDQIASSIGKMNFLDRQ